MSTGKLLLSIFGALVALLGLGASIAGGVLLWGHTTQRDADGFFTSRTYDLATPTYALTTEDIALAAHPGDWFPEEDDLVLRVTVTPATDDPVFVGIAAQDDLDDYLDDVAHARLTRLGAAADDVTLQEEPGGAPDGSPADAPIWTATTEGKGTQALEWEAERGAWALAIMNADGSANVAVEATAAVRTDLVFPIAVGLVVAGLLGLGAGAVMVLVGVAGSSALAPRAVAGSPGDRASSHPVHPVRVEGRLDPDLSRWQWLVKWVLALPHMVVLAVLWAAFSVLTVVAGFAILFTGRYPRGIFDFNVGVLRWTWRVTFYAFGVLGTDRYPPFSLAPDPDYPADLDVTYPSELSRGLVLVKWWLLALPHYLIVGLFTGGLVTWTVDVGAPDGFQTAFGGGLIGLLVLIAGIVLLFSSRYPRAIFDLVVGLQRWVHRVIAYAALMTDVYPPFRLDAGGSEPSPSPAGPPTAPPTSEGSHHGLAHT